MKRWLKSIIIVTVAAGAAIMMQSLAMAKNFEPIEFLNGVGVMTGDEKGNFSLESSVKREELATIAVRLLGREAEAKGISGGCGFDDVPEGHWASGYIYVARSCNIIDGFSDSEFGLGQHVTYEQAVKIIVSILGYDSYAQMLGGYSDGYIAWASDNELLDGVGGKISEPMLRKDIARLIYNAVEKPIMKIVGKSGYNYVGETNKDVTILSEYLHIEEQKGIVTANSRTGLDDADMNTKKGSVEIDGVLYNCGTTAADTFLGRSVVFYATDGEEDEKTIKLIKSRYEDDTIKILPEDIIDIDLDGVNYYDGNRTRNKKFSDLVDVIYNEKAYNGFNSKNMSLLKMDFGNVVLIDNDNDDVIDVLLAKNYTNHLVSSVNVDEEIISFKDGTAALRADEDLILTDDDGMELTVEDVNANSIISLMCNPDTKAVQAAMVVSDWVRGTVETINSGDKEVVISGQAYDYDVAVESKLKIGTSGIFYLNGDGVISAVDADDMKANQDYAYLITVSEDDAPDDDVLSCKIMTMDGKISRYNINGNTVLDGKKLNSASKLDYVTSTFKTSSVKIGEMSQPVIVKLDGGNVKSIDRLDSENAWSGEAVYKSGLKCFVNGAQMICYANNDTKVVYVGRNEHVKDDTYYGTGSINDLVGSRTFAGGFSAYDIDYEDGTRVAGLIVVSIDDTDIGSMTRSIGRSGIITDMTSGVNLDGEFIYEVTVTGIDGDVKLELTSDKIAGLELGDFVAYLNKTYLGIEKSQIMLLNSLDDITATEEEYVYPTNGFLEHSFRYAVGVIHKINGNYITIGGTDATEKESTVYYADSVKVVIYDKDNKRESVVTGTEDLLNGYEYRNSPDSRVIIFTSETRVTGIILYK